MCTVLNRYSALYVCVCFQLVYSHLVDSGFWCMHALLREVYFECVHFNLCAYLMITCLVCAVWSVCSMSCYFTLPLQNRKWSWNIYHTSDVGLRANIVLVKVSSILSVPCPHSCSVQMLHAVSPAYLCALVSLVYLPLPFSMLASFSKQFLKYHYSCRVLYLTSLHARMCIRKGRAWK